MTDEIRVMPGMILGYQPDPWRQETILYVSSTRQAKKWVTARLKGHSGDPLPGRVWAIMDYTVRFPDGVVREPFRLLSGADLKPRLQFCAHHDTHDDEGQPTGEPCGKPATHVIWWPENRRWSPACPDHISDDTFDSSAPPHTVKELPR